MPNFTIVQHQNIVKINSGQTVLLPNSSLCHQMWVRTKKRVGFYGKGEVTLKPPLFPKRAGQNWFPPAWSCQPCYQTLHGIYRSDGHNHQAIHFVWERGAQVHLLVNNRDCSLIDERSNVCSMLLNIDHNPKLLSLPLYHMLLSRFAFLSATFVVV